MHCLKVNIYVDNHHIVDNKLSNKTVTILYKLYNFS
jgi:hypothetical protein